jgi:hemerythrin
MTGRAFQWDDSFLIGIEELDHEHRVLVDDINRLHRELSRHDGRSEAAKCLGDIYARMRAHFALEERVMKENGYKFFDEHKLEHEELLDTYTEYMVRFLNDAGVSSGKSIEDALERWVMQHIVTSDRKMGLMVKKT